MKHYPPEFKADAVALFRSRPGATIAQVAADLGINRETLRSWIRLDDQRRGTAEPARSATRAPTGRLVRWRRRTPSCAGGYGSWSRSATSCVRRPGISPGDALVNRFQFVADHSQRYGLKRLWQVLDIARSSYYHWKAAGQARADRAAADQQLAERIRAVHAASDGTYGGPRITAELRERGERVNHKRVARIMRGAGLQGLRLRRRHRTTVPDPAAAKAPDLIGRDFTAPAPNRRRHRQHHRAARRRGRAPGRAQQLTRPRNLADTTAELGPRAFAATSGEAAAAGDIVVITVPVEAFPTLPAAPLAGKTVIDTCNYGPERDGHIPKLDSTSLSWSELLLRYIPDAMVVKAFNNSYLARRSPFG